MKQSFVYIFQKVFELDQATVPLFDLGVTRGFGAFEYLRTYHQTPFHLKHHLKRLEASAKALGIFLPETPEKITEVIHSLIAKLGKHEASIKLFLTGGISDSGIEFENRPTFAIAVYPFFLHIPTSYYSKGISVMTYPHERFYPRCKSLNYLPAIIALQKANQHGFQDSLFIDRNHHLLEATTSNFFAIVKNTLITPRENILHGITRDVVIKLCERTYAVEERVIHYDEIKKFDEAFITSSNKEIVPITTIDSTQISDGSVGQKTQKIIDMFQDYTHKLKFIDQELQHHS